MHQPERAIFETVQARVWGTVSDTAKGNDKSCDLPPEPLATVSVQSWESIFVRLADRRMGDEDRLPSWGLALCQLWGREYPIW